MLPAFHLTASIALPDSGEMPSRIVYLPEGTHEVHGSVNGKPQKRTVTVGPDALAPLQEALAARLEKNVRPFGGFDHKDGKASFIPKAFHYEAGRGVVLEVEWTKSGREAIEGKDYSYFSPSMLLSKQTGKPVGLPAHGEIGSLVNEPAFEAIERIAASHQTVTEMDTKELVKLGLCTEEQAEKGENLPEIIKASIETAQAAAVSAAVTEATKDAPEKSELEKELGVIKEKLATAESELKTANEALSAKRAAEADEAINEAVKAGRIPAQDEDTKAFWRDSILKDDSGKAKAQLAKLPDAEALKANRNKGGEDNKDQKGPSHLSKVQAAFKEQISRAN